MEIGPKKYQFSYYLKIFLKQSFTMTVQQLVQWSYIIILMSNKIIFKFLV